MDPTCQGEAVLDCRAQKPSYETPGKQPCPSSAHRAGLKGTCLCSSHLWSSGSHSSFVIKEWKKLLHQLQSGGAPPGPSFCSALEVGLNGTLIPTVRTQPLGRSQMLLVFSGGRS